MTTRLITCLALLCFTARVNAITPGEWRYRQSLQIDAPGLIRVELPPETLDAARSGLEDLRLLNSVGNEVPFTMERPIPRGGSNIRPTDFRYSATPELTTIVLENKRREPIVGVSLETPAGGFLKSVRVEGTSDGIEWQELAVDQPIFRMPGGVEKLRVAITEGTWAMLRLTIDDRRARQIPFTGAMFQTPDTAAPAKPVAVTVKSRDETPGVTRLALDLGGTNLPLASIRLETPEPLFTRSVALAVPQVTEEGICEQSIGQATIYRVNVGDRNEALLTIPVEKQIRSRELFLLIRNEDSPPLVVTSVQAERRVVRLVFMAPESGTYSLLTGNSQCPAARYDLTGLGAQLKDAVAAEAKPAQLVENPDYKSLEVLPTLTLAGAPIDVAGWKYRKPVQLTRPGVQQVELDLEVLSHATPNHRDLRLVRQGQQVPFILEHPSIQRELAVNASPVVDPKKPTRSRWMLKLPQPLLPITRLACTSPTLLFQRDLRLWEEIADRRGEKYSRELGRASWQQASGRKQRELVIQINQLPQTDTLYLDTDNGDNPAIELREFRCYHPVTRAVFKAAPDLTQTLWLYYGNQEVSAPKYDLSLVADQLLRAERSAAAAGAEELTKGGRTVLGEAVLDHGGIIFWSVLATVVAALLFILARFLPKASNNPPASNP